ncbi:MAG: sugar phosphate nucleotidyltransferase [Bacteroides sp.]|jgi:NDP-sugar pyrophosphorylase family protein|nr:sugar phosphate nucleotidyltransferase [Bacteroides sp.]
MNLTLLVLAAGKGSRYGGMKQLDRVGPSGETIMDYSVYDAIRAGFNKVVFVIRRSFEQEFREVFVERLKDKIQVELAFQELDNLPMEVNFAPDREKPWGTGHAIWVAGHLINEPFAMINADDFYGFSAYDTMARYLKTQVSKSTGLYAMAGYLLENTLSDHGKVARGICKVDANGFLDNVKEHNAIRRLEDGRIVSEDNGDKLTTLNPDDIVSMNFWGFGTDLFPHLEEKLLYFMKVNAFDLKAEFFIPKVVDELVSKGKAKVRVLPCDASWFGVTYREDKEKVMESIRLMIDSGAYPDNLWA